MSNTFFSISYIYLKEYLWYSVLNARHISGTCGNVDRLWTQLLNQLQRTPYGLVLANEGFLGWKKKTKQLRLELVLTWDKITFKLHNEHKEVDWVSSSGCQILRFWVCGSGPSPIQSVSVWQPIFLRKVNLLLKKTASWNVSPFSPCFRQCSRTTKNCCRGGYSESSVLPRLMEDWINTLMLSFIMLRRLDLSIDMGSLGGRTVQNVGKEKALK